MGTVWSQGGVRLARPLSLKWSYGACMRSGQNIRRSVVTRMSCMDSWRYRCGESHACNGKLTHQPALSMPCPSYCDILLWCAPDELAGCTSWILPGRNRLLSTTTGSGRASDICLSSVVNLSI